MTNEIPARGGMPIQAVNSLHRRELGIHPGGRAVPAMNLRQHERDARATVACELAAEVLRSSGSLRLRAIGASMLPAIWPGDVLTVQRRDAENAQPGDIVLFARGGALVAHRVVERTL